MKVITFSRQFPAGHPKAKQSTCFVEKVMACLADTVPNWTMKNDFVLYDWYAYYNCTMPKGHTIRGGNRWKVGDMASFRVWSDKPYRSKQIEFAQVEIKKVWNIEIYQGAEVWEFKLNDNPLTWDDCDLNEFVDTLAKNDGLTTPDFLSWFSIHPKAKERTFRGQIISWSDKIDYDVLSTTGKPDLNTL